MMLIRVACEHSDAHLSGIADIIRVMVLWHGRRARHGGRYLQSATWLLTVLTGDVHMASAYRRPCFMMLPIKLRLPQPAGELYASPRRAGDPAPKSRGLERHLRSTRCHSIAG